MATETQLTAAWHALLTGDATLAGLLPVYAGRPAVFLTDPVPEDAARPYVQSVGTNAAPPPLDLDGKLRTYGRAITVYADAKGDPAPINAIADRLTILLDAANLSVAGHRTVGMTVAGPVAFSPDPESYARTFDVTVWLFPTS